MPRAEHGGAPTNAPLTPGGERLLASDEYVYVTRSTSSLGPTHTSPAGAVAPSASGWAAGTIEPDPEHWDHMYAYRCGIARVSLVDDTLAISAEVAREAGQKPTDD